MKTSITGLDWTGRAIARSCLLTLIAATGIATTLPTFANDPANRFFDSLQQLCGARFEGAMTFPADGLDDFAGKLLVAEIGPCSPVEIRIPFAVGEDTSRTWIISHTSTGLQLQHDHRHADGKEDAISMYGGMSGPEGSADTQSFSADAHTIELIPEAATNIWTISLGDNGNTLTYSLQRHGNPRFEAQLRRAGNPQPDREP